MLPNSSPKCISELILFKTFSDPPILTVHCRAAHIGIFAHKFQIVGAKSAPIWKC